MKCTIKITRYLIFEKPRSSSQYLSLVVCVANCLGEFGISESYVSVQNLKSNYVQDVGQTGNGKLKKYSDKILR